MKRLLLIAILVVSANLAIAQPVSQPGAPASIASAGPVALPAAGEDPVGGSPVGSTGTVALGVSIGGTVRHGGMGGGSLSGLGWPAGHGPEWGRVRQGPIRAAAARIIIAEG
mgnify:CR=1 FL=1